MHKIKALFFGVARKGVPGLVAAGAMVASGASFAQSAAGDGLATAVTTSLSSGGSDITTVGGIILGLVALVTLVRMVKSSAH